jgi:hypothetical protein
MWEWIKSLPKSLQKASSCNPTLGFETSKVSRFIDWGLEGQSTSKLTNHGLNGKVLMFITNEWACIAKQKIFS